MINSPLGMHGRFVQKSMAIAVLLFFTAPWGVRAEIRFQNEVPGLAELVAKHGEGSERYARMAAELNQSAYYQRIFGPLSAADAQSIEPMLARIGNVYSRTQQETIRDGIMRAIETFKQQFPDFRDDFTVVLTPSFQRFAGQARPFDDSEILLIGVDKIGLTAAGVLPHEFLHHELSHIYRYQVSTECRRGAREFFEQGRLPPLASLLWEEGIACYVARTMHPGAPESRIFIDVPLVETRARWAELLAEVELGTRPGSDTSIAGFFYFPRQGGRPIPINSGYAIGHAIVESVAKRVPLSELLRLEGPQLQVEISRAIRDLQVQGPRN